MDSSVGTGLHWKHAENGLMSLRSGVLYVITASKDASSYFLTIKSVGQHSGFGWSDLQKCKAVAQEHADLKRLQIQSAA